MKILDYYLYAGALIVQGVYIKTNYEHTNRDAKWSAFLYLSVGVYYLLLLIIGFFSKEIVKSISHSPILSVLSILTVAIILSIRYYILNRIEYISDGFLKLPKKLQLFYRITSPIVLLGSIIAFYTFY